MKRAVCDFVPQGSCQSLNTFPRIYYMVDHISHGALTIYPSVFLNVLYKSVIFEIYSM